MTVPSCGGDGGTPEEAGRDTRVLVEGALCVALSVVLSHLVFLRMPQGGSITLEMAPLLYFSYRHGFKKGVLAGGLSGLLQMFLGGYVVHPLQAMLDYPLAFAAMGVAGLFARKLVAGTFAACALRLLCHVLTGVVFFSRYAPELQNPWIYSLVYNSTYIVPSTALSATAAWILACRLGGVRK